jgi:excisionase family DNA binding protein
MDQPVYTTFQISQYLSVDITTVMSWVDDGKLSAYKTPGGHRRVLQSDFLEFLRKYRMPVPAALGGTANRKVLIVDDEPQTLRLINRLIKKIDEKLGIDMAADGFEAGRKLEVFAPDLVVLDLNLPGIDGFKVCKTIRSGERSKRTKILAISGSNSDENRKRILSCGADEFMAKPFEADAFAVAIKRLLDIRSKN